MGKIHTRIPKVYLYSMDCISSRGWQLRSNLVLVWYIGDCLVLIITINNCIKEPIRAYQYRNTSQMLMFRRYVKV